MNGINEMQLTHHTDQQIEKTNVPRLLQTIKAIAPRSYEKAFHGMDDQVVIFAMGKAVNGLTKAQIEIGLNTMFEQGFCPDPVMFRKWCLGITGFTDNVDPIHASYRKKSAALANIEAWLMDDTIKITNAEREAYNRCYSMFNELKWRNSDKQKFHTYEAFKDFYDEVVKEFVSQGVKQEIWIKPIAIERKPIAVIRKNYLDDLTDEQKQQGQEVQDKIKALVDGGMPMPSAMLQIAKEAIQRS